MTVDEITQVRVKATLITKGNDHCINPHNRVMLQHWRANVDFKPLSTLNSASVTWQSMQRKVNRDHSQHLKYLVFA